MRNLLTETKRFDELKSSLGMISQKVLTQNLRAMEADGLVKRTVYAVVPPRVEYKLTELGKSLERILKSMCNWGIQYKEGIISL